MWLEETVRRLRSGASVPRRGVDRQHRRARSHATLARAHRDPAGRHVDAGRAAALVDPRAAREQPLAQAEGKARRVHGRAARDEHAAAEHRRRAARPRVLGALREHAGPVDGVGADAVLRGGGGDAQLAAAPVPGVDALGLAPCADRVDRLPGGVDPCRRGRVAVVRAQRRQAQVQARHEAAVAPARAVAAAARLEHDHAGARREGEHVPGGPQPGVAAADHDDVGRRVAVQRRQHGRAPRLGHPVPVGVVEHQPRCASRAAATASRSTSRSAAGTSTPIGSRPVNVAGTPASPSRIARFASGRCSSE